MVVLRGDLMGEKWITAVKLFSQTIAFGLLFTPPSREWMTRKAHSAEVFS